MARPPSRRRDPRITSRIMSAVRRVDTRPELALRRALWEAGLRGYRVDARGLPGRPDVVFSRARVAVFVDGAFWHGHRSRYRKGIAGAYWDEKIAGNRLRDRRANYALRRLGWRVLRVWDFEVAKDAVTIARRVGQLYRAGLSELQRDLMAERVR